MEAAGIERMAVRTGTPINLQLQEPGSRTNKMRSPLKAYIPIDIRAIYPARRAKRGLFETEISTPSGWIDAATKSQELNRLRWLKRTLSLLSTLFRVVDTDATEQKVGSLEN